MPNPSRKTTPEKVICTISLCGISQRQSDFISAFSLFTNRASRYQKRNLGSVDLRQHRLFHSSANVDCCPTQTEIRTKMSGVNPQGILLELFYKDNFTQSFYETFCHQDIKERPCQFIDPRYAPYSRCVQQYSYVYALGRAYMRYQEQFRIDFIRVATGCKCQVSEDAAIQELVLNDEEK